VEAAWQDMQQKAAHELVGIERHDLLALGAAAPVILVAEGDTSSKAISRRFEMATRWV
jgi:hypothetical protein